MKITQQHTCNPHDGSGT